MNGEGTILAARLPRPPPCTPPLCYLSPIRTVICDTYNSADDEALRAAIVTAQHGRYSLSNLARSTATCMYVVAN